MKIQTKFLNDIFLEGKKIPPQKIVQSTGLSMRQVYNALAHLKDRGLIRVTPNEEEREKGYKQAPYKKVLIEVNENVLDRIKKVIQRGEDE